ncbi:MAG TPA: WYL domain-containing protein, partial [Gemmatimonadota bacterium]|nr:WYL domain-containing protein [Gemmatimonadota bacterium]
AGGRLLALLRDATRARRPCRLEYLKPDSAEPESRAVHPYVMVYASGHWYVLGADPEIGEDRAFRLDRILEATVGEGGYEVPPDFDAGEWIEEGGLFLADTALEARVRYSARVAPWIREASRAGEIEREEGPEGTLVVRHRVADPGWLVRHVLAYGAEAELLEPAEMRDLVARRSEALGGA